MEEYPLYINGKTAGTLSVYTEGLLTVFRAQCRLEHGIIKLYVFGEGKSAYLGTMQPGKNGQYLVRKFSRSEKSRLPSKISYAADARLSDKEDDADLWLGVSRRTACSIASTEKTALSQYPQSCGKSLRAWT